MRQKSNEQTKQKAKVDANGYEVHSTCHGHLSLNYSFNISENTGATINKHTMRYPYKYTHNLNVSGNIEDVEQVAVQLHQRLRLPEQEDYTNGHDHLTRPALFHHDV
jgi:hypothetical protein